MSRRIGRYLAVYKACVSYQGADMSTKRFWLSFDLGIVGAYDDLYAWLDKIKATECGESVASFSLDVKGNKEPEKAVLDEIKKHKIKLKAKDRLYLIWRVADGTMRGKFIHGRRKRSPWAGCSVEGAEESEAGE